eukprot:5466610-Prymnesium_polylepis.1
MQWCNSRPQGCVSIRSGVRGIGVGVRSGERSRNAARGCGGQWRELVRGQEHNVFVVSPDA